MIKYKGFTYTLLAHMLKKPMIKKFGKSKTKESIKKGRNIYKDMLNKTDDIGKDNPMIFNIYMGYVLMAICRAGHFDIDEFKEVTKDFINNKLVHRFVASLNLNDQKDLNKMKKSIAKYVKYNNEHLQYKGKYWEFNFDDKLHKDGIYFYYSHCPMAKFAKEYSFEKELNIGCDIDYLTCKAKHGVLYREQTLVTGGDKCDYWIVGDESKNPK